MGIYWRLLGFAKPIEKYAIPYFFYTIFYAVFNTCNFVMILPILETLFDKNGVVETVTQMPDFALNMEFFRGFVNFILYKVYGADYTAMNVLLFLGFFLITSAFLSNLFRYLGQWTVENMKIRTLYRMRNTVFDNVMRLPVGYFSNERKGDIISKITSDVQVVQFCVTNTLQVAFREPFLIIGYVFALLKISWELTVFSIITLPVIALVIGGIVKKLRASAREVQENFGNMVSALDESLAGVKVVKAYNATGFMEKKFHTINEIFSKLSRSMARRQQLASPMSEFLGISAVGILLFFGGNLVLNGKLDGASFLVYIGIFSQITRPVRAFTDAFATIHQGVAAGERVLQLIDTTSTIQEKPDAVAMTGFKDTIEFRNVRFSYDNREVIHGINFTVKHGQTVALVGPSGGGKSTISDLIPRFYDVAEGEILIDGINVKDYKIDSVREHIGVVSQDTILFNDTIENNIRLGKQNATIAEVENAAKIANAHHFIMESENGYQTNIGDRGMKLSGGQRQRLSIARAVLKNPSVLILDEATSALDTESEKLVQQALDSLLVGRTSIVIAHRLSTIFNADKIIVVDQGRIAEEGTHAELMERNGIYRKLIEMQQLA